jgi:hypothetical protein
VKFLVIDLLNCNFLKINLSLETSPLSEFVQFEYLFGAILFILWGPFGKCSPSLPFRLIALFFALIVILEMNPNTIGIFISEN